MSTDPGDILLSDLADDEDMIELVEEFVQELPKRASAVEQALQGGDIAALSRLAHQLKGAAGGYGFGPISDIAGELESSLSGVVEMQDLAKQVNELAAMCLKARAK